MDLTDAQKFTLRNNSIDSLIDVGIIPEGVVSDICYDLEQDGLPIRNRLIGGGLYSLIFKPDTVKLSAIRIGNADHPAESVILLRPLHTIPYSYTSNDGDTGELLLHHVPYAPDIAPDDNENQQGKNPRAVLPQDIFNSLRVLKAEQRTTEDGTVETLDSHLSDCRTIERLTGHFVYLRGIDGKLVRYPECEDKTISGRPIAFIRDLNCLPAVRPKEDGMGRIEDALKLLGKTEADLTPAPTECVAACAQQNEVITAARLELNALRANTGFANPAVRAPAILPRGITPGSTALNRVDRPLTSD